MKTIKTLLKTIKKGDSMKVSGSILKIKDDKTKIKKMMISGIDYLHLDIMDGKFVENKTFSYEECLEINLANEIPLDVHLMVNNPLKYINQFINLSPKIITFHVENDNIGENITIIKSNNISVGLAINPTTDIEKIIPYLDKIDLVLVMSVEPGYGGQVFNENVLSKIDFLKNLRIKNNLNYLIEVDGGINIENVTKIDCDIVVIGSGITDYNDYSKQVSRIKELI